MSKKIKNNLAVERAMRRRAEAAVNVSSEMRKLKDRLGIGHQPQAGGRNLGPPPPAIPAVSPSVHSVGAPIRPQTNQAPASGEGPSITRYDQVVPHTMHIHNSSSPHSESLDTIPVGAYQEMEKQLDEQRNLSGERLRMLGQQEQLLSHLHNQIAEYNQEIRRQRVVINSFNDIQSDLSQRLKKQVEANSILAESESDYQKRYIEARDLLRERDDDVRSLRIDLNHQRRTNEAFKQGSVEWDKQVKHLKCDLESQRIMYAKDREVCSEQLRANFMMGRTVDTKDGKGEVIGYRVQKIHTILGVEIYYQVRNTVDGFVDWHHTVVEIVDNTKDNTTAGGVELTKEESEFVDYLVQHADSNVHTGGSYIKDLKDKFDISCKAYNESRERAEFLETKITKVSSYNDALCKDMATLKQEVQDQKDKQAAVVKICDAQWRCDALMGQQVQASFTDGSTVSGTVLGYRIKRERSDSGVDANVRLDVHGNVGLHQWFGLHRVKSL